MAHVIEENARNLFTYLGGRFYQSGMTSLPQILGSADIVKGEVLDIQQTALLQVRGRNPPSSFKVSVDAVAQYSPKCFMCLFESAEANLRIGGIELKRQVKLIKHLLYQLVVT